MFPTSDEEQESTQERLIGSTSSKRQTPISSPTDRLSGPRLHSTLPHVFRTVSSAGRPGHGETRTAILTWTLRTLSSSGLQRKPVALIYNTVVTSTLAVYLAMRLYETGCPLPQYTTAAACGRGVGNARQQAAFTNVSPPCSTASSIVPTHVTALVARDDWSEDMTDGCGMTMDVAFYLEDGADERDIDQVMARLGNTGLSSHCYVHRSLGTILIFVSQIPESLMEKISIMPG